MPAPTRVYLTVDVECAEERTSRGRQLPALGYDERVWGRFSNQDEELGIPLIMRELEACGHRGTFFVEALGARHFGIEGLSQVCRAIRRRGHDLQLHLHPMQRLPHYRSLGVAPLRDDMHAYSAERQWQLIEEGLQILAAAGVRREEVSAFRAGNFGANNQTWRAMARAGLSVSSNLNASFLGRNCAIAWPRSESGLFDTGRGVWELPISNFVEPSGAYRHLQLMAVSLPEIYEYLWQARALGIGEVTIFTHSFECFYLEDVVKRRARPSRVNFGRLRGLCRFLREHSKEFEVDTVGELAARLARDAPQLGNGSAAPPPRGRPLYRYERILEQVYKRVESRFQVESHYSM